MQEKYELLEKETVTLRNRVSELLIEMDALRENIVVRDEKMVELKGENASLNSTNQGQRPPLEVRPEAHEISIDASKREILLSVKEEFFPDAEAPAKATGRKQKAQRSDMERFEVPASILCERVL